MSMNRRTREKGFTLIELLVVIAIIAILAAILFPVFAQAKLAAKKAADISNLKQVELSTMMYMNDFDDIYPLLRQGHAKWECNYSATSPHNPVDCQQVDNAAVSTNPYVKNRAVWAAPDDSIFRNDCPGYPQNYGNQNNPGGTLSYTYNYYGQKNYNGADLTNNNDVAYGRTFALGLVGWEDNYGSGAEDYYSTVSLSSTQVGDPADTVLMYPYYASFSYWNGQQAYSEDGRRVVFNNQTSVGGIPLWPDVYQAYFWCGPTDKIAIGGYGPTTNIGWADGHVKSVAITNQGLGGGQLGGQLMDPRWVTDPTDALANHYLNRLAYDESYHGGG